MDEYFASDGNQPKVAKFQNLYISKPFRARGIAQYLNITRADVMLEKGYEGIFLAPFSDAIKTLHFHERNGLKEICRYPSVTKYKDGKRVMISCCVNKSLKKMLSKWQRQLDAKTAKNAAFTFNKGY